MNQETVSRSASSPLPAAPPPGIANGGIEPAPAWHRYALKLFRGGNVTAATDALERALEFGGGPVVWNDYGTCLFTLKRFGEAEAAFRKALALDPSYERAAANLRAQRLVAPVCSQRLFAPPALPATAVKAAASPASAAASPAPASPAAASAAASPAAAAPVPQNRAAIAGYLRDALERFYKAPAPPSATPCPEEADPEWLDGLLRQRAISEEDHLVFHAFRDPRSVILDLGAHYGYTAISFWSCDSGASVLSVEANPIYESCLRHLAELRPGQYDFRIIALGEAAGALRLAVPLLNGHPVGGLATMRWPPNIKCLAKNLAAHWETNFPGESFASFGMHVAEVPVTRLDDLLASGGFAVPTDNVVAVKVDTEEYEAEVLAGAASLLARQKPLVVAECGHQNARLRCQMLSLGYQYARRVGRQLEIAPGPVECVNGFFIHRDRIAEYRRLGLLYEPTCVAAASATPVMDAYEKLHAGDPNHAEGAFPTRVLRRIEALLPAAVENSVETGCGRSTILFSNLARHHKVFALDDSAHRDSSVEFFRRCPLTRNDRIEIVFGPTQRTLPTYTGHVPYDLVLIDGPHGYPFPELEYLALYPHLRPGGFLLLDDVDIPSIGRLGDFLAEDEMFELIEIVERTAVFRRTLAPTFDPAADGWWAQRYNRRRVSPRRDIFLDDGPVVDRISSRRLDHILRGL